MCAEYFERNKTSISFVKYLSADLIKKLFSIIMKIMNMEQERQTNILHV